MVMMMNDPVNIPTEEELKDRLAKEKRETDKEDADLLEVLNSPSGRRLMFRVIDHAETLSEAFVAGGSDLTSYNLGRIAEGRHWFKEILRLSPDKYMQMCRERKSALIVKEQITKGE